MERETSSESSDAEGQLSEWSTEEQPRATGSSFGDLMSRERDSDSSTESSEEEEAAPEEFSRNSESSESSEEEEWLDSLEQPSGPDEQEAVEDEGRGDRAKLEQPSTRETYELFRKYAADRTGAMSFDDVKRAVHELWPHFDHELPLWRAYEAADCDANGCIGRREFHLLLSNTVHFDSLWELFDTIDVGNPENRMELEDFHAACAAVGLATENATDEFRACAKAEGVSVAHLGFDNFCDWMLQQKRKAHLTTAQGTNRRPKPAPPARKPKQQQSVVAKPGGASPRLQQQGSETESDEDEGVSLGTVQQPTGKAAPMYDSDSSGSELSDDDAAVALLARIRNSPFRAGVTPVRDETPAKSATAASAQARLSQLLDELGSPPSGRGASRSKRFSSGAARSTQYGSRSATPQQDPSLRADLGSEQKDSWSDGPSSSGERHASSIHDRLYAASSSSGGRQSNSIHDRLYAHKTATTSGDPLAKVNLKKHGLSQEAMVLKAKAEKLKADTRAEQRAVDEAYFREERRRAAKERQEAKEQRVRAMRLAAMADKKQADELKQQRKAQEDEEKAAIRLARREALEQAKALKEREKKEEEELLKERREERERQAAMNAKLEEERRREKRREMLMRREQVLEMRQRKQAAAAAETEMLFASRIDAATEAEVHSTLV